MKFWFKTLWPSQNIWSLTKECTLRWLRCQLKSILLDSLIFNRMKIPILIDLYFILSNCNMLYVCMDSQIWEDNLNLLLSLKSDDYLKLSPLYARICIEKMAKIWMENSPCKICCQNVSSKMGADIIVVLYTAYAFLFKFCSS